MTQSDTVPTHDEGNTKLRRRARQFCFTLNNYTQNDIDTIIHYVISLNGEYIIGKEIAPSTGTPHLQGYIKMKNAISFTALKKIIPKAHIEIARGTKIENINYCNKENEVLTNIISKKKVPMPEVINITLNEWQLNIIELLNTPDRRTIHWVVDFEGNKGKTTLCKYILDNYENVIYFTGGKSSDIASQIILCEMDPFIALFDFTRSKDGYISYEAIESVKNGLVNTPKYKGGFKSFNNPHVFIFSNFEPETSKLSVDRWNIIYI